MGQHQFYFQKLDKVLKNLFKSCPSAWIVLFLPSVFAESFRQSVKKCKHKSCAVWAAEQVCCWLQFMFCYENTIYSGGHRWVFLYLMTFSKFLIKIFKNKNANRCLNVSFILHKIFAFFRHQHKNISLMTTPLYIDRNSLTPF